MSTASLNTPVRVAKKITGQTSDGVSHEWEPGKFRPTIDNNSAALMTAKELILRFYDSGTEEEKAKMRELNARIVQKMAKTEGLAFSESMFKDLLSNDPRPLSYIEERRKGDGFVSGVIEGPPGTGKTHATAEGARMFAEALGLNFVHDIDNNPDYRPKPNDFVFAKFNLSGAEDVRSSTGSLFTIDEISLNKEYENTLQLSIVEACLQAGIDPKNVQFNMKKIEDNENSLSVISTTNPDVDKIIRAQIEKMLEQASEEGYVVSNEGLTRSAISYTSFETKEGMDFYISRPNLVAADVTRVIPSHKLTCVQKARYSLVVLDELSNAYDSARNQALELLQFHAVNGVSLGKTVVVGTGNLGELDGTIANGIPSSAENSRTFRMLVVGTGEGVSQYLTKKYGSDAASFYMSSFMQLKGDQLLNDQLIRAQERENDALSPAAQRAGVINPRSIDNTVAMLNSHLFSYVFRVEEDGQIVKRADLRELRSMIEQLAQSTTSPELVSAYVTHIYSMEADALPLANDLYTQLRMTVPQIKEATKNLASKESVEELASISRVLFDKPITLPSFSTRFNQRELFGENPASRTGLQRDNIARTAYALADVCVQTVRDQMKEYLNGEPPNLEKHSAGIRAIVYLNMTTLFSGLAHLNNPSIANAALSKVTDALIHVPGLNYTGAGNKFSGFLYNTAYGYGISDALTAVMSAGLYGPTDTPEAKERALSIAQGLQANALGVTLDFIRENTLKKKEAKKGSSSPKPA